MEEELVGQIFEAMMISASGEGFVLFSATRGGRVAKCWERKTSPTADDEIRPDDQDSGQPTRLRSSGPPIGGPLSPD
ncbi:hypothetical protein DAPPUDRAFT_264074 [Daphnia pulex]|uniref:Uncharacterized protein n=1 Tax=Daphnia pulex TaxID=6669 RepID=E9HQU5_DAPPU|nr:hypothetical protein DAPPUDRAFT_264074 [Daphnia pulex]|eukprot:EFX65888.1 hypothetical protein DAPPUDRAFT_264074 [Daphnia pulex]